MFVGGGDFLNIGNEYLQYFIDLGGLKPTSKVLDVGCGVGRMAIPLTNYLSNKGSYEGFDIVPKGIHWCTKNISPKFPNFKFHLANIYNKAYNPKGNVNSINYKFPYGDKSFDLIFLTSVFTHMLPTDLENYLSEISRVLKKGGKCLITYFVLDHTSLRHIKKNESAFSFNYGFGDYRVHDKLVPEYAIAFKKDYLTNLYLNNSLSIINPIYFGSWSGREDHLSFQDIIVAKKI